MAQGFTPLLVLACLLMATIVAPSGTSGGVSTTTEALATTTGGGVQPPATEATTLQSVGGPTTSTTGGSRQLPPAAAATAVMLPTDTAQGRSNATDRSGFSFQNCSVTADEGANLTGVMTYLGRPWKNHSHVIFMESFLDSIVNFTGWLEWEGRGPIPKTVVYLEYANYGPGADTSRRINTTAVKVITKCSEAAQYTADPFVNASAWMPKDRKGRDIIPYARGLIREPACPPAPARA